MQVGQGLAYELHESKISFNVSIIGQDSKGLAHFSTKCSHSSLPPYGRQLTQLMAGHLLFCRSGASSGPVSGATAAAHSSRMQGGRGAARGDLLRHLL